MRIISNVAERLEKDAVARRSIGTQPFPDDFSAVISITRCWTRISQVTQASSIASKATAVTQTAMRAGRAQAQSAEKAREMDASAVQGAELPGININRTQVESA